MVPFEGIVLKIEVKTTSSLNLSLYTMTYFLVDVPREGELQSSLRLMIFYLYLVIRYMLLFGYIPSRRAAIIVFEGKIFFSNDVVFWYAGCPLSRYIAGSLKLSNAEG